MVCLDQQNKRFWGSGPLVNNKIILEYLYQSKTSTSIIVRARDVKGLALFCSAFSEEQKKPKRSGARSSPAPLLHNCIGKGGRPNTIIIIKVKKTKIPTNYCRNLTTCKTL